MKLIHIGLLSAMPQEVGTVIENLDNLNCIKYGDLKIYSGLLNMKDSYPLKIKLSVAWSGWGKVSAARAATRLISMINNEKNIDALFFTGVAGAADSLLNQWDVIIGNELIQYDVDARPLFERFVIPPLNKDKLFPSRDLADWAYSTLSASSSTGDLENFGIIKKGLIATGDTFISSNTFLSELSQAIPGLNAVEMEGAAVAQVAEQEGVPCLIIRVISDSANDSAPLDFNIFLEKYQKYSWKLIEQLFNNISKLKILI